MTNRLLRHFRGKESGNEYLFLLAATLDLYLSRSTRMMTSAMTKRVSTTPMRMPNTGVNSSGTGLSVIRWNANV